jgi:hypothetical protein
VCNLLNTVYNYKITVSKLYLCMPGFRINAFKNGSNLL